MGDPLLRDAFHSLQIRARIGEVESWKSVVEPSCELRVRKAGGLPAKLCLPSFHLCPLGTMRSAMLFAAILVLCLAGSFGAVCEESQGQVAPAGRHSEVRCPLTGSSISGRLGILSVWIAGGRKVGWWHFVPRCLFCFRCLQGISLSWISCR